MNIKGILSDYENNKIALQKAAAQKQQEEEDRRSSNAQRLDDIFRQVIEPVLIEARTQLMAGNYPALVEHLKPLFAEGNTQKLLRIKLQVQRKGSEKPSYLILGGEENDLTVIVKTKVIKEDYTEEDSTFTKQLADCSKENVSEIVEEFLRAVFVS